MLRQNYPAPPNTKPANSIERLFSDNFIEHQLSIATAASRILTTSGLLEANKMNTLIHYMRDLYVNPESGVIFGKTDPNRSLDELVMLVNRLMSHLLQHYKWSGRHPLIPALDTIKQNVLSYIRIMQPQVEHKEENSDTSTDQQDWLDIPPAAAVPEQERVFSDHFIKLQFALFVTASHQVTDEGILEQERIQAILDHMQDLFINTHTFLMSGQIVVTRTYDTLISLIDQFATDLKSHYHSEYTHPLLPAVIAMKNNIAAVIRVSQPQFAANLAVSLNNDQASVMKSRIEIAKDTCGILACLAWIVPEKIVTLGNCCEPLVGNERSFCPEEKLPQRGMHWKLWSPVNSMSSLCQDIKTQNNTIETLQSNPVRQIMK